MKPAMYRRHNPYAKQGADQHGRVCFYIYNDDGSQVVGPTGPKFCYSAEKAAEMIKKAEGAGKRVSPSSVSPGPRAAAPPPAAAPAAASKTRDANAAYLASRFEQLRPILDRHLQASAEGIWGGVRGTRGRPRRVEGIEERRKYAVIHSGTNGKRNSTRVDPEFAVDLETLHIARADDDGRPRPGWDYGHIDDVIARGRALPPDSRLDYI